MNRFILAFAIVCCSPLIGISQSIFDDFEGNGNIKNWFGDNCLLDTQKVNPFPQSFNSSATVLAYNDNGGQYANARFDLSKPLNLSVDYVFSFKIYVPSNSVSGNQPNQVSLKLQNGKITEPWSTQTEIIKSIVLNQWQTLRFDFKNDAYLNLNSGSLPPIQRLDFNRILIQVNGENNNNNVIAYIDDFNYQSSSSIDPIFDKLVWSDEFDTPGAISNTKWFPQTQLPNSGSWYNGEVQHYTNRIDNSVVANGMLKVIAKKESFTDQGQTKQFTSARLNSKFAFKYGKVVFRAKLPTGVGTWPAVWMLSKSIDENGAYWDNLGFGSTPWPQCGEIDIMEHWGSNQNFVQSAIHTTSSYGNTFNLGGQTIPTASSNFHVYSLEWMTDKMIFSVDSVVHYIYNPLLKDSTTWPFNTEQYLLINVAIQANIASSFTQSALEMDYIRVYQESSNSNLSEIVGNTILPKFFPNPVLDELIIQHEITTELPIPIQLFSIDGKLVHSESYYMYNNSLVLKNLGDLAKGIYFVNYTFNQNNIRFKFLKN